MSSTNAATNPDKVSLQTELNVRRIERSSVLLRQRHLIPSFFSMPVPKPSILSRCFHFINLWSKSRNHRGVENWLESSCSVLRSKLSSASFSARTERENLPSARVSRQLRPQIDRSARQRDIDRLFLHLPPGIEVGAGRSETGRTVLAHSSRRRIASLRVVSHCDPTLRSRQAFLRGARSRGARV